MTDNRDEQVHPVSLTVKNLSKSFGPVRALKDVSFSVKAGTVHALLGGNGSGKSTLIKALAGVQTAESGTVEVNGKAIDAAALTPGWAKAAGLAFVHQNVGVFPSLSVMENFAMPTGYTSRGLAGISWGKLRRQTQEILDDYDLKVDARTRMGDLRPAMQTMIAVARAIHIEHDNDHGVLILDEPTASLPSDEATQVLESARSIALRGHTVVLVSHRLDEVLEYSDDATFLRDGAHLETVGVHSLTERSIVQRIAGIDHLPDVHVERRASFAPLLDVKDLSTGPVQNLTFSVNSGEIVGLVGLLGSGRSSVLKSLFGVHRPRSGSLILDGRSIRLQHPWHAMKLGVAYVPEDRNKDAAFPDQSIELNLSIARLSKFWRWGAFDNRAQVANATSTIRSYGVVASSYAASFASMSGGNAQKVVMARWLGRQPRLLLIDEPTQGVDIGARADIHRRLLEAARAGMGVLVVSSDSSELAELCDRVVGIANGRKSGELAGSEVTLAACADLTHGLTDDGPEQVRRHIS